MNAADIPKTDSPTTPDVPWDIRADKQLRVSLDKTLQDLKTLDSSRERALAITKIQEAIMWLGMDLKRLAEQNPYPHSYDPDSPVIDPTADDLKL